MSIWRDSNILITGITGSLGTALTKRLLSRDDAPRRLVGISRKWQDQARLRAEMNNDPRLRLFIGDVRDKERLLTAFRGVNYIIHAGAHKDVVSAEYDAPEAIATNVIGTQNVLWAAMECKVSRVLVVSTDKASDPINTYGKTKSLAESLAVCFNSYSGSSGTRYSAARYGNVAGSSGSVIPLFRQQKEKGVLTITSADMSRFWISMDRAVDFVLTCLSVMIGGEIFVPHLPSAKVVDVAAAIAPEAKLEVVGVRPGEKIHETMITPSEAYRTRDQGWAYVVYPQYHFWDSRYPEKMSGSPVPADWTYSSASAPHIGGSDLKLLVQ